MRIKNTSFLVDRFQANRLETFMYFVMILAVGVGLYGRFKGLGHWPFSSDEFHTVQSVQYILESGFPEFPCGGYYMRGILLQYLMAFTSFFGGSDELNFRLVPVVFNIAALPAIFMLGKRVSGPVVACLAVTIFSISLWEIELARFARMYVPFQTIFCWYILFLYKYLIDDDKKAIKWMFLFSVLSLFIYKGSVFLLLLNFLPLVQKKKYPGFKYTFVSIFIFIFGYIFLSMNFSEIGIVPPDTQVVTAKSSIIYPFIIIFEAIRENIAWYLSLIFIVLNIFAIKYVIREKFFCIENTREKICLLLLVLCSMFNLVGLLFSSIVVFIFLGWINLDVRLNKTLKRLSFIVVLNLILLSLYLVYNWDQYQYLLGFDHLSLRKILVVFFKYPDIFNKFIYPWVRTFPIHVIFLFFPVFFGMIEAIKTQNENRQGFKLLIAIILSLIFLMTTLRIPYDATRYTFFLYPLIIIIFSCSLYNFIKKYLNYKKYYKVVFVLACFTFLLISEDISVEHVFAIDSKEVFFGSELNKWQKMHYYSKSDTRGVAHIVDVNFSAGDLVISTLRPVNYYLHHLDYHYYPSTGEEFLNYSACGGTREKWTGAKLVYNEKSFFDLLNTNVSTIWLILPSEQADWPNPMQLRLQKKYRQNLFFTSLDGKMNVYRIPSL